MIGYYGGKNISILAEVIKISSKKEYEYLPEIRLEEIEDRSYIELEVVGNSPCPCCGFITIPNNGDAIAYICPICYWEIDVFIQSDDEASDQNHGVTLFEARKNFQDFGAVLSSLKKYCRQAKQYEYPIK